MSLPDSNSLNDFGGAKVNYSPPVDSSTDYDASQVNQVFANAAMSSRTVTRGWLRFTLGTSPALISATSWNTVWKGATATVPTIAHTGTGTYTITFPTTVSDELGVSHTVNIQSVMAQLEGVGTWTCSPSSANVIALNTYNTSWSANDLSGVNVNVWFI